MKKTLYLNDRETESFYELLEVKKDLITMALYKVNIPKKLHHEFYNYGLEGKLKKKTSTDSLSLPLKEN